MFCSEISKTKFLDDKRYKGGKFGINPTYGFSERPFKVFLYSKMNADL